MKKKSKSGTGKNIILTISYSNKFLIDFLKILMVALFTLNDTRNDTFSSFHTHIYHFTISFINHLTDSDVGGWGEWSNWTPCSTTCAGGTRNRYRVCDSPPPRYGAMFCEVNNIIVSIYFIQKMFQILFYVSIETFITINYITYHSTFLITTKITFILLSFGSLN